MGRSYDQAAGPEMLAHHSGEQALRSCVERGRGLVEQPQRPPRDEQPRERDSPLLARRQRAHRKIGDMGEAEPPERREPSPAARIASENARPELQILPRGESPLQGVGVADAMRLLAQARLGVAALQDEASFRKRQETRDRPQQARFARAVRTDRHQRLARADLKREAGKQPASAPLERDFLGAEAHEAPDSSAGEMRPRSIVCVAARRDYIYNAVIPKPHSFLGDAAWPASTVSNARKT